MMHNLNTSYIPVTSELCQRCLRSLSFSLSSYHSYFLIQRTCIPCYELFVIVFILPPVSAAGDAFNHICLCTCPVWSLNFWTLCPRNFIFCLQVHLNNIHVKFTDYQIHRSRSSGQGQGHRRKDHTSVTNPFTTDPVKALHFAIEV